MNDTITLTGTVGTPPKYTTTTNGLGFTSFRLAINPRRYDRATNTYVDGETSWFNVTAWRKLGLNVVQSVQVGERVIVIGRLRIREWQNESKKGLSADIDATSIGHDLYWGTSSYTKIATASSAERGRDADPAESEWAAPGTGQGFGDGGPAAAPTAGISAYPLGAYDDADLDDSDDDESDDDESAGVREYGGTEAPVPF
jgi:single-strand DNA-binding protein